MICPFMCRTSISWSSSSSHLIKGFFSRRINNATAAAATTKAITKPMIKSLKLKPVIEKTYAVNSSVTGLFIGQVDTFVLSYPSLLVQKEELTHVKQQHELIRDSFATLCHASMDNHKESPFDYGFGDLQDFTATEIVSIFEAIGRSNCKNSANLVTENNNDNSTLQVEEENLKLILRIINENFDIQTTEGLTLRRLSIAAFLLGKLKTYYEMSLKRAEGRCKDGKLIPNLGIDNSHLYVMLEQIFLLESLTYYTSGMIDSFEGRDLEPEMLILKITASEVMDKVLKSSSRFLGPTLGPVGDLLFKFCDGYPDSSSFMNKIHLGHLGVRIYGENRHEEIEQNRSNPTFWNNIEGKPSKLGLDVYFLRSFHPCIELIEAMIARLRNDTRDSFKQMIDVKDSTALHLADSLITIWQSIVPLVRGNRSLMDHLENFDADLVIAEHIVEDFVNKSKTGSYAIRRQLMAEKMMETGGYYSSSPLFLKQRSQEQEKLADGRGEILLPQPESNNDYPVKQGLN